MANTSAVYARIDNGLKENAENILSQLGISPSSAIQMFYSQIVLTKGLPLNLRLPSARPTAIGNMGRAELDAELMKGVEGAWHMSSSYSVVYSPKAKDDLKEIYSYIAFTLLVPETAAGQVDRIVVFYTVDKSAMTVTIIRIVYGGRDFASIADSET